jgi:CheY-like chemotaxis protein
MVIEDNTEMRCMIAELLYASGYLVFSAADAPGACTLARTLRPAAVLCDVNLPTWTGFEAAARLQRDPETRRIPVILMSGYLEHQDKLSLTGRWLNKPFTGEELNHTLREAVKYRT